MFNVKIFFYLILFSFVFSLSKADNSGVPFIKNYKAKEYKGQTQNYAIVEDDRGILYVGNGKGLLEYDGAEWRTINLGINSAVVALAKTKEGRILVGGVNDFGYLYYDLSGKTKYKSLINLIPKEKRNFADIWGIHIYNNEIFFRSYEGIFKFSSDLKFLKIYDNYEYFLRSYIVKNKFLVNIYEIGIVEFKDNEFRYLKGTDFFKENIITGIIQPNHNEIYIFTAVDGAYIYNVYEGTVKPFAKSHVLNNLLLKYNLNVICNLPNGFKAFGTKQNGLIITDSLLNVKQIIDKKSGLQDNFVKNIYVDKQHNIWLALDNGITKVEIFSSLTQYDERLGLQGVVLAVSYLNDELYVATSQGLFYFNNSKFTRIEEIKYQVFDLVNFKTNNQQHLLASTGNGVFEIVNHKLVTANEIVVFNIIPSSRLNGVFFMGGLNGLYSMEYKNGKYGKIRYYNKISNEIRNVVEDANGVLWLCTYNQGAFKVDIKNYDSIIYDVEKITVEKNALPQNSDNRFVKINNKVYLQSPKGIFEWENGKFIKSKILPHYYSRNDVGFYKLNSDSLNNITYNVFNKKFSRVEYAYKNFDGNLEIDSTSFLRLPDMEIYTLKKLKMNELWVGGSEGLFKFNLNQKNKYENIAFEVFIRKVILNNDSTILFSNLQDSFEFNYFLKFNDSLKAFNIKNIPEFDIQYNNITIHFASPYFIDESLIKFSYYLEGYDKNWSQWSTDTKVHFTNLKEGLYTFQVKAKNIYGIESKIAKYTFKIATPWYKTIWAYILFAIIIISVIIFLMKLYNKHLRKKNDHLEEIIKERTNLLTKQKNEIEKQNNLLANLNNDLIIEKDQAQKQRDVLFELNQDLLQQKEEVATQRDQINEMYKEMERSNIELEKLSIVAKKTNNAVIITDNKGNLEWVNDAFISIYGFSLVEFIHERGESIVSASGLENILEKFDYCQQHKKSITYTAPLKTKKGDWIWVQTTLTPILDKNKNIAKFIAIDTDITKIKEANEEIEKQREDIKQKASELENAYFELSKKNRLLTDSIIYAERIQQAILPTRDFINSVFPQNLIYYQPKDIVSGDFYWVKDFKDKAFVAVVDCTGHGVPGAFMSLIGYNLLEETIYENTNANTGQILDLLKSKLSQKLQNNTNDLIYDGMDISLCVIYKNQNKLEFSGAYSSLYIYRNNELIEIKGNKLTVGISLNDDNKTFSSTNFEYQKGDMLYMFTDGYIDQLGGKNNEKYYLCNFQNLLSRIQSMSIENQHTLVSSVMESWKFNHPQIDDMLIVGIRL